MDFQPISQYTTATLISMSRISAIKPSLFEHKTTLHWLAPIFHSKFALSVQKMALKILNFIGKEITIYLYFLMHSLYEVKKCVSNPSVRKWFWFGIQLYLNDKRKKLSFITFVIKGLLNSFVPIMRALRWESFHKKINGNERSSNQKRLLYHALHWL